MTSAQGPKPVIGGRTLGPVTLALAVLALSINEVGYYSVERLFEQNAVILEARALADQLRVTALAMESAKRGYMLTERDTYLEPYNEMNRQFEPLLKRVQAMAERYPKQREQLLALAEAAQRKQSEMVEVLGRFQSGNRAGAMDLTLTEIGRENMVRVNQIADEIKTQETLAFVNGRKLNTDLRWWNRTGITGLVLLVVGAVFALLRLSRARVKMIARVI